MSTKNGNASPSIVLQLGSYSYLFAVTHNTHTHSLHYQSCEELMRVAGEISPEVDVELACTNLGTGPNEPEQLLLDCYVRERREGNYQKLNSL